jgi:hypothetical protein
MSFLTDAVNARIALLTRQADPPTGDLQFGSDLFCDTDLTPTVDEVDPASLLAVGQADFRRLTTGRGALLDDEDYGYDVRTFLATGVTTAEIQGRSGAIRNELRKDDRHESIDQVSITETAPQSYELKIRATLAEGPYTLTLAVVDGEALLKEIS